MKSHNIHNVKSLYYFCYISCSTDTKVYLRDILFERFLGLLIDESSYCTFCTFCTTTVKGCKVGFFAELILIQINCVKSVDQSMIIE